MVSCETFIYLFFLIWQCFKNSAINKWPPLPLKKKKKKDNMSKQQFRSSLGCLLSAKKVGVPLYKIFIVHFTKGKTSPKLLQIGKSEELDNIFSFY